MSGARFTIGCVPYLNGRPLVAWFHKGSGARYVDVVYAVPSELARMLQSGQLDAAMVSSFETIHTPGTSILSDCSIAANGPVRSVRLFCNRDVASTRSVALDTSSLTSAALVRILLAEQHGIAPTYVPHRPDLGTMLAHHDAGLIIGDLRMFEDAAPVVIDLGEAWKQMTGLPFLYAAWLCREQGQSETLSDLLSSARDWGVARIGDIASYWASRQALPCDLVYDYYANIMEYRITPGHMQALALYGDLCRRHGLVDGPTP